MSPRIFISLFLTITAFTLPYNGFATTVTFNDQTAFITATNATSATGMLPNLGLISGSQTVGSVTFSPVAPNGPLFVGSTGNPQVPPTGWSIPLPGHDIAISGREDMDVQFNGLVYSAGFDFIELNDSMPVYGNGGTLSGTNSTFTVTLVNQGTVIGSFMFNAPDDTLSFVGVWSDTPFDQMEIRETTGAFDDEYFGEFFSGVQPLQNNPVPTVSQWGLILLGLGVVGWGAGVVFRRNTRWIKRT